MNRPSASHSNDDIIEIPIVAQPDNDRYDDIVEIPQTDPLALDVTAANISGETIEHTKDSRLKQILAKPAKDSQISTSAQMLNMPTLSTTTVPNSMPNNATFSDVSSSKREVPSNSANRNSKRFKILDVNMSKPSSINHPLGTANTTPNPCQTSLAYRSGLTSIGTELDVINNIGQETPAVQNSRSLYSNVITCTGSYVVHSDGKTYYTTPAGSFVVASRIERPQVPRRKSKSPGSDNPALPVTIQQPILPNVNHQPLVHPLFTRKTSPNVQQDFRNKSKSPEREISPMAAARPVVSNNSVLQPSGSTSANLVHPLLGRQPAPNSQQVSRAKSKSPEGNNSLRSFRRKSKSTEVNNFLRREETSNIPYNQQVSRTKSKSPEVNNSLRLDDSIHQSLERGRPVNRCKTIKNVSLSRRPIEQPENTNVSIDNEERLSTSELALRQSMAFNQPESSKTSNVTNANRKENLGLANYQVFFKLSSFDF